MVPNVDEADNLARMERGELYYAFTPNLVAARRRCGEAVGRFNRAGDLTRREIAQHWKEITNDDTPLPAPGASTEEDDQILQSYPWIERPINIDYGTNIKVGVNVFINFNCTIIDTCLVSIGSRTMFGPNVSLYSGTHPLDPDLRDGTNGPEYGKPVTIGDDCWLAGNVIILPGVTIGNGCVVGAGSVVTKQDSNIAVIGTVATSVYFLGGPIATPLVARFQAWQRHMIVVGWLGCCVSLAVASFMSSVPGLIATQGVLYGFAFTLLYYPVLRMLNEWFVHRRGFAFGIMSTGAGCSGVGLPFLLEWLLAKYGYQTTLRAMAVVQFITVLPVIPLLKGRLPVSRQGTLRKDDFGFLKKPLFYCFAFVNLLEALGYYIPFLYLPTYATSLGLSGTTGALILAANNLAMIFGQLALGYVSDRVKNVLTLVFASSFSAAVASFTIWGYGGSGPCYLMIPGRSTR
ncbi:putative acetyltransferase [Colletotrichum gloeosporioides]|uniref:Putative acetyltransferase n=1 Tax=Colletotrichum gloeosporioides TaxID=474922 RepID=A0A8H4CRQ0_COLGL|nr:putative acetyltransferase [Colletotrichum gloeosporioides]KAF3808901.1 putative acetyltransferase [Colletotrichum gloeosporioides]